MLPQPPPMEGMPLIEPGRIKVFGIIHIVFGSLGLLNIVFQVIMTAVREPFTRFTTQGQPEELVELQVQMYHDMAAGTWISLAVGSVVAVFILRAGIMLVRKRKSALKANQAYVIVSLIAKVLGIVIFYVMLLPVLNRTFEGMLEPGSPAQLKTVVETMKISMYVAGMVIPVLGAIYPVLSLLMLKKPEVKQFLAERGT